MARSQGDVSVTLSVLDRLIDWNRRAQVEAPLSRSQSVRLLKAAVRRDLEWLLNTRRIAEPRRSPQRTQSLALLLRTSRLLQLCHGIAGGPGEILRQILATIKLFEPRLGSVRIVPLDSRQPECKSCGLRIEGMLLMDPVPEPVSFDTVIELKSGVCRLSGGADAR